jgi:hypothetical protein
MCVSERRRAEDVLVDAVIVWENLFGAKNDTTLRVSSSLAWLLGTSPADRLERQRQYKNIYQLRSDIVHGSASIKDKVVQSSSTEAVAISIAALRKIFDEKPYLLTIDDSALRSLHLIHNVEPTDVAQES